MQSWQTLCDSDELPESESRGFSLKGEEHSPLAVLVVRKKGQVYAYRNLCPHAFIPLEWEPNEFLSFDKSLIQCANHGALFTIEEGLCVSGPCSGQSLIRLETEEAGGKIRIRSA